MCYSLIKPLLFCLDPERAHYLALNSLKILSTLGLARLLPAPTPLPRQIMGLTFPNPVGLAAGFDKNGDYIDALATLGFGFIEVGTVTPKPQEGNPRPRLFRLSQQEAIINRLGFNNKGVDYLVKQLQKKRFRGIIGVNIGKNRDTSLENATHDYLYGFQRLAPYASYITINISSPNTPELRSLQHGELLRELLHSLKNEQTQFLKAEKKYVPLIVKLAPDLTFDELKIISQTLLLEKIDGIIATNTTITRPYLEETSETKESGGLSGKPLCSLSTQVIKNLQSLLMNKIPIIASGGLVSEKAALEKLAAGASLVQVYSGLIFRGPGFVTSLVKKLAALSELSQT